LGKSGWLAGLALGALAGIVLYRRLAPPAHMPNARVWRGELRRRHGAAKGAELLARAQELYRELYARRPDYSRQAGALSRLVLDYHAVWQILPALAVYRILREEGLEPTAARDEVLELAWTTIGPLYRSGLAWLPRLRRPFPAWKRTVALAMQTIFPPAGWGRRWVADETARYCFDITACIYLRTLSGYGAAELTPIFCWIDDQMARLLPASIVFERAGTLALGQDRCDFCWRRV